MSRYVVLDICKVNGSGWFVKLGSSNGYARELRSMRWNNKDYCTFPIIPQTYDIYIKVLYDRTFNLLGCMVTLIFNSFLNFLHLQFGASSVQYAAPKYEFPVKRLLLTRDPKDRSVGGNGLGMRVIGGKEIPGTGGQLGAFVTRIYPGGVVETLGEIKEGDQVLEWNGVPLTGKTFEEVQKLVSQTEGEVEIVVKSSKTNAPPKPPRRSIQSLDNQVDHNGNNSNSSTYENIGDEGERKMSEYDSRTDLKKKKKNMREKNMENQRKTRYFSRTCEPEWSTTMVYENVSPEELNTRYLEVTAWNYDIYHPNHFLGGVILDLSDPTVVDEEARWYRLQDDPMLQASFNNHNSGWKSLLNRVMQFFKPLGIIYQNTVVSLLPIWCYRPTYLISTIKNASRKLQLTEVSSSKASTILFVVSASVLMRGLPEGLIFCILPISSSRFLHFPTVDGCNATLNSCLAASRLQFRSLSPSS
ncbi:hypothetical protein L9F63_013682, partial [Diploptera punctata]